MKRVKLTRRDGVVQRYWVEPMRPKETKDKSPGGQYQSEVKFDGTRMYLMTTKTDTKLINRRKVDKSAIFPELNSLHKELGPGLVIDGEVIHSSKDEPWGDFHSLAMREHLKVANPVIVRKIPLRFMAFDILYRDGKSLMHLPYEARRKILESLLLKRGLRYDLISLSAREDVPNWVHLKKQHAEGVVFKDRQSHYLPGSKGKEWLKYKFTREADLVVTGFTPGEGNRKGLVGNLHTAVWRRGQLVPVGNVGAGFTFEDLRRFKRVGLPKFIRVRYRRLGSSGKMVEPRYLGDRDDIRKEDTHI